MPHDRIGAGLDHVALVDGVADMKRDGCAVAHHGDVADDLLDPADGVGRCGRLGLRILSGRNRTGEQFDEFGGQARPVGRDQRGPLLVGEIAGDDVTVVVRSGDDEVGTGMMVLTGKQQRRVRDVDMVCVSRIDADHG